MSPTFNRIATVKVKVSDTDSLTADLTITGDIFQPTLTGPQKLGHINSWGDYQLINGQQGNMFGEERVRVIGNPNSLDPLTLSLKTAKRLRAMRGSEIPLIRAQLTNQGINGAGIKIGILDTLSPRAKPRDHAQLVTQTVSDPVWGVAPGAAVLDLGTPLNLENDFVADQPQAFAEKLTTDYTGLYTHMSRQLQGLIAARDPALRVLNITNGLDRVSKYNEVFQKLHEQTEAGYFKYSNMRANVLSSSLFGSYGQQYQAVINKVDEVLDNSPVVQAAYKQYLDMTYQAAKAGLIIVAAAANSHDELIYPAKTKTSSELNDLAKSPYVIMVAASNTNQMPGYYPGYHLTSFSSRGDGGSFNPTVTAPGSEIPFSFSAGKLAHDLVEEGTSFATPFTCGVIAMMLQVNPSLTFNQVKTILQSTAYKTPYYNLTEVGAGFLNTCLAVKQAMGTNVAR